jgi:hypothetical protein
MEKLVKSVRAGRRLKFWATVHLCVVVVRARKKKKRRRSREKRGGYRKSGDESRVVVGGGWGLKDEFELLRFLHQFPESVIISTKLASTKCGWPRDN